MFLDQQSFEAAYLEAKSCVYIDSGREQTSLVKLTFDDAEICTRKFAQLIRELLVVSGDSQCSYVLLNPDPVYFFFRTFNKYPAFRISGRMSDDEYLVALNSSPDQNLGNALGASWNEIAIFPPFLKWFIHVLRSDRDVGGHLWVASEWVQHVVKIYPYVKLS